MIWPVNNSNNSEQYTFKILSNPDDILEYLFIGTVIPIWKEFHKYILHDLSYFKAKAILLQQYGNPAGFVLIFNTDKDTLYFGFFGVSGDNREYIKILLNNLIDYARKHKFAYLRGPINIPAIIFGWGFMEVGSDDSIYIGKPVNPPVYQEIFLSLEFHIAHEAETWEGELLEIPPWHVRPYDFDDYEYFNPKDWDELMRLRERLLELHRNNLPPTSRITPNVEDVFDNYAEFITTFGGYFMFPFVRHKLTNKIIASGICLPNPFSINHDSMVGFSWAVDSEHREKGVGMLMYGMVGLQARKKGIIRCSGPIASTNIASRTFAQRVGYILKRVHAIFEKSL